MKGLSLIFTVLLFVFAGKIHQMLQNAQALPLAHPQKTVPLSSAPPAPPFQKFPTSSTFAQQHLL
jgi:hypothetical protein